MNSSESIAELTGTLPPARVFLGMGASLGDRKANLRRGLRCLEDKGAARILAVSPLYESPHLGLKPGDDMRYPPHLNAAAKIETRLQPTELLDELLQAEAFVGRVRGEKWGPRILDLDLLFWHGCTLKTDRLTLPHPELTRRAFVVRPLLDLEPDLALEDGTPLRNFVPTLELDFRTLVRVQNVEWLNERD